MMKFRLICSDSKRELYENILTKYNLQMQHDSPYQICEKALETTQDGSAIKLIIDDPKDLSFFLDTFISTLQKKKINIALFLDGKIALVPLHSVLYFQAKEKKVLCIAEDLKGEIHETLYDLENNLPRNQFCRISKSCIVNLFRIKEIFPWFGRNLMLSFGNKTQVEVSRNYIKLLKDRLDL